MSELSHPVVSELPVTVTTAAVAPVEQPKVLTSKPSFWPKIPKGSLRSIAVVFLFSYEPLLAIWFPDHKPAMVYQICQTVGTAMGLLGITRAYGATIMLKIAAWGQGVKTDNADGKVG